MNVIVAGKQPALNWLSMDEAIVHCTRGIGIWEWASERRRRRARRGARLLRRRADARDAGRRRAILRERLPDLKVRVVNVVDLMRLAARVRASARAVRPRLRHPVHHRTGPVVFAYHGYPWLIHRLTYRRTNHDNMHVRGYKEEGTTTTPFDMVMLNDLDRFHLVMDVIDRVPGLGTRAADLRQEMVDTRIRCRAWTREHGDDPGRDQRLDVALLRVGRPNAGLTSLVVASGTESVRLASLDDVDPAAIDAVAHRIVHGGEAFRSPALVDDAVLAELAQLRSLAPLHNTPALRELDEARRRFPDLPHVAVFDTAFHATIPPAAATYAVPRRWREEWGVRRYGFHGLSVAWSAERAPKVVGRPPQRRCARWCATSAAAAR